METIVAGYTKTDHFLLRQWERKIPDEVIKAILDRIGKIHHSTLIIISRNFLKKYWKCFTEELFLIVDRRTLITCYFGKITMYSKKKRNQNLIIIQ